MPRSILYGQNVFINCPFDSKYTPLFQAIIFTVHDCGFRPRCALEASNAGQFRLEKIMGIIHECKYGIHDISRTQLDRINRLPRFNMPLELGLDLGSRRFGNKRHKAKIHLIMDTESYRYQKFISDIAGQDVYAHEGNKERAVSIVRDWLRAGSGQTRIPSGAKIYQRYQIFQKDLPKICTRLNWNVKQLPFVDFSYAVATWLSANPL